MWFKPISTQLKLHPASAWLLDELLISTLIEFSMRYFIFYPTNDRCIHYLLCIDLLKIIAVPIVQLDLIEIIVLEQFLSFRRKQRGEMQLRPWLCFSICFLQCCLSCFLERLNPIWLTSTNSKFVNLASSRLVKAIQDLE